MSTFEGRIKELNGVSVDRFDGCNLDSSVFFLSHCHTDHMIGLTYNFWEMLVRENKHLYASSISATILRARFPNMELCQLKELPLQRITSVPIGDQRISVICTPAGHCPGSVMFLFETSETCILYTGDYRISAKDITKFGCFYDTFGQVKRVDKIYLDTTFFLESYLYLPSREDSLSELCRIILSWVSQGRENCIKLDVGAKYGYEYVFKEIYEKCKMPVHTDAEKYDFYSVIPELEKCVTTNGSSTQIHNCSFGQTEMCDPLTNGNVRTVRLSAFRWGNKDIKSAISEVDASGLFYVCYATHASYEEGTALINFLKPKDVHVCVERPEDPAATLNIRKLVQKQLRSIHGGEALESPKLFDVEYLTCRSTGKISKQSSSQVGSILDSPPR